MRIFSIMKKKLDNCYKENETLRAQLAEAETTNSVLAKELVSTKEHRERLLAALKEKPYRDDFDGLVLQLAEAEERATGQGIVADSYFLIKEAQEREARMREALLFIRENAEDIEWELLIGYIDAVMEAEYDKLIADQSDAPQKADARDAVVQAARVIMNVTGSTGMTKDFCPHGQSPNYPTHAWWCDQCWGALQSALEALDDE